MAELKFLRALLEKPLKLVVEVNDVSNPTDKIDSNDGNDEAHIPAWDILDSDFETFPDLPHFIEPIDTLTNDTAVYEKTWVTQLSLFKEENEVVFVLTLTIALIVIVGVFVFMVWFCCLRECLRKKDVPVSDVVEPEVLNDVAPIAEAEVNEIDSGISSSLFREDETWDDIFEPRELCGQIEMQARRPVTTDL